MATTYALPGAKPPQAIFNHFIAPVSRIAREIEIVDAAGEPYIELRDNRIIGGSVSVDMTRAERRSFQLDIDNHDGKLQHTTGELWYDKIVRIWRGIEYKNGSVWDRWLTPCGEFLIDNIASGSFPSTISIQGRDWMKQLLISKFHAPTTFAKGMKVEDLIKTIAQNGGIDKFNMIETGQTTGKDWAFDSQVARADAIKQIATDYSLECFFDGSGFLVLREFQDPYLTPPSFTFAVDSEDGNLASFKRTSNDTRLYNTVVVIGQSANNTPIYATAQNTVPGSPTSVAEIGERTYFYSSSFITTQEQAQKVANDFLAIHALEEYSMSLESIVFPWLEAGDVVRTTGVRVTPIEPNVFLNSSFAIPLGLATMSSTVLRVSKVVDDA